MLSTIIWVGYLVAKNAGKVKIMKELKGKLNGFNLEIKMAEKKYTELKTNLGYESPASEVVIVLVGHLR